MEMELLKAAEKWNMGEGLIELCRKWLGLTQAPYIRLLPSLYFFARDYAIKTVLELGTGNLAESTCAWSYAGCQVISVDVLPQYNPKKILKVLGLKNNVRFINADDQFPPLRKTKFDLVYIDTSHRYEHTKRELEIYCGWAPLILLDDVSWQQEKQAINEFCQTHPGYVFRELQDYHVDIGLLEVKK